MNKLALKGTNELVLPIIGRMSAIKGVSNIGVMAGMVGIAGKEVGTVGSIIAMSKNIISDKIPISKEGKLCCVALMVIIWRDSCT